MGDRSELNSKYGKIVAAVLWPKDSSSGSDTQSLGGEGSAINNGSITIEFDLAGVTVFSAGDLEPEPQAALLQRGSLHQVTILKMFHHGSKYQDFAALKNCHLR